MNLCDLLKPKDLGNMIKYLIKGGDYGRKRTKCYKV
jgi:hypothetical protein